MSDRETSNIRRTKFQTLNVSRLVLQLSLPNPFKPGPIKTWYDRNKAKHDKATRIFYGKPLKYVKWPFGYLEFGTKRDHGQMYHETITEVILFCKIYIPVIHFITFVWYIFCSFQMCVNWAIFTLSWVYIKCQPLHRSHQPRTSLISLYTANKTSNSLQICNVISYIYSYFECIFVHNPAGIGLRLTRPCHTAITNSHGYITPTTNR